MKSVLFLLLCFFLPVFAVTKEDVTLELLDSLFQQYYEDDPLLEEYVANFPLEKYEIYKVENREIYFVDDVPDLIKAQFLRKGLFYEVHVFEQLWRYTRPGSVVVDIGGHVGTHTLNLTRLVEKEGMVHVFEPQLKLFVELVINLHLNQRTNVKAYRKAVGSEHGVITMNVRNPHNEGGVGIGSGGDIAEMVKLDDYHLNDVSLIKIDVEGGEMGVIDGAYQTILENRPVILIEIMGGVGYEGANPEQREEIHKRMSVIEKMGYSVHCYKMHDYLCLPLDRNDYRIR